MITIKTLPQATAQEVFDQVATHLLTQNAKSGIPRKAGFDCRYRDPGGRKCAAGCLIGDDEYKDRFEGTTWTGLKVFVDGSHRSGPPVEEHKYLIIALQQIHDWHPVVEWRAQLGVVADNNMLSATVLDRLP